MSDKRLIKKYPNRRLYDTVISSYITLEDVRKLVLEDVLVKVVDARTDEDLTHATLLQIIMEQEESGPPVFSNQALEQMIKCYGQSMQSMLNKFFNSSFGFFNQQKPDSEAFQNTFKDWMSKNPVDVINDMTKQNVSAWQSWQKAWMNNFAKAGTGSNGSTNDGEAEAHKTQTEKEGALEGK